jgi:hypothetical protein
MWSILCLNIINFTEPSPSWDACSCAATQELPRILWNPKVHYRVHKSPPLVPILGHIDSVETIRFILILSTHLRLGLPSGLFPPGFSTSILYAFLFSPLVLHTLLISSSLIRSFSLYLERSARHVALYCAVLCLNIDSKTSGTMHKIFWRSLNLFVGKSSDYRPPP